jgi:2-dehydro-3-deoxyphosphogluconate aldolase/(4S)-4-hydroxy-2-oxoglutarate aldolase
MQRMHELFPNGLGGEVIATDAQAAFNAAKAAVDGGIGTIAISAAVSEWADIIMGLKASIGELPVGASSVMRRDLVAAAHAAGASFVATPMLIPEVTKSARELGLACIVGCVTPTEVYQALGVHGAEMANIAPVSVLGGPNYLRWLKASLPGLPLCVSGGVELDQIDHYRNAGATAIWLDSKLFTAVAMASRDYAQITELARKAVSDSQR